MKENLILIIKGMIIGLANVIPGVSGGTLMITLGIYEQVINTISNIFINLKKNLKFIIPLGIGVILSLLLFSKIIGISLEKFPFATTLFFLGLILGGFPMIIKKLNVKNNKNYFSNYLISFLSFSFIMIFAMLKSGNNIDLNNLTILKTGLLFIVGIIASATMVIPGISGSFMLMLLGFYKPIIDTIRNLTNFNLLIHNGLILSIFGLGVLIGIILVSKLIEMLLKKYEIKTYYAVFGFILASIFAIIKPLLDVKLNILELIFGIFFLIIGFIFAYKIGNK